MGSEKSATQIGNAEGWGVGEKKLRGNFGVGTDVSARRGVTNGGTVNVSTGALTAGVGERTFPRPHARINRIAPEKKNKSFMSFISNIPSQKFLPNRSSLLYTNIG